ncbi:MAG: glycine cleavage system aminomethyltransferase GcvT [Saprospirales bacterium]|nr:MAG: glycine cleavage system aminomethyltransferase GcvT [Saprospirales bacterium]
MKKTPLFQKHIDSGAKMNPFAGFEMPVVYSSITAEHHAVRKNAGMFDVSHMGEFIVRGREAAKFVQYVTSNDVEKLYPGRVQYSCFPNEQGGIVDDLLVYRLFEDDHNPGEQAFMLVVNGANLAKDWRWVNKNNRFEAELTDVSDQTGLIALQGPLAAEILGKVSEIDLVDFPYYHFKKGKVAGFSNVLVSTTGYTGSGGFEIYADANQIGGIWDSLVKAGKSHGLALAGLGARDTLRLEMGFCLYGNDIDDATSPLEAGLGWITKLKKGNFIGCDKIQELKEKGLSRRLVGFSVQDRRVPRNGYEIVDQADEVIGRVTSGTQAPSLGYPIGMGYVNIPWSAPGTDIWVLAGRKKLHCKVEKLPFYQNT